jgi:hypothetical protein
MCRWERRTDGQSLPINVSKKKYPRRSGAEVCGPSHLLKSGPVASGSVRIQIGMNVGGADGTETGRGAHGAVTHGGERAFDNVGRARGRRPHPERLAVGRGDARGYIASEHVKWGALVSSSVSRARNRARGTRGIRGECCSGRGRRDGSRRSCWSRTATVSDGGTL